ncbi:MAG: GIY-YIG nuclease family protein [Bacteroidales bacterium]
MHKVYIIYSGTLDRYYIGQTQDLERRVAQHNEGFYKDSFTTRSKDWELYFQIECASRKQAIAIELHIKRMKSRRYLENLKTYPELSEKLKERY